MATGPQTRPLTRDKLAQITGNNHEAIRFLESLFTDSVTVYDQVAAALLEAENARFRAEQAITDAMSARQKAETALTAGEILALVSPLIKPERKQPRPDDAGYIIAGQMYGSR